jgi:hypothetical protein
MRIHCDNANAATFYLAQLHSQFHIGHITACSYFGTGYNFLMNSESIEFNQYWLSDHLCTFSWPSILLNKYLIAYNTLMCVLKRIWLSEGSVHKIPDQADIRCSFSIANLFWIDDFIQKKIVMFIAFEFQLIYKNIRFVAWLYYAHYFHAKCLISGREKQKWINIHFVLLSNGNVRNHTHFFFQNWFNEIIIIIIQILF